MFSGIIEALGKVELIEHEGSNVHFTVSSPVSDESYIDQSIAHDGACLTVVKKESGKHVVTAIKETIDLTNLGAWKEGSLVNIERCVVANQRMDGHFVQGHVDTVGKCINIEQLDGSWYYQFSFDPSFAKLIVSKGSITVNGISLTVIDPGKNHFKVGIIPYTHEHTNFKDLEIGSPVNLEFDILGKYIQRNLKF